MGGSRSANFTVDPDAPILAARHPVIGDILSGIADNASEPVKVGMVYKGSPPALTSGQRTDALADTVGNLKVTLLGGGQSGAAAGGNGDGEAGLFAAILAARLEVFNGATWDRLRTAVVFKPVNAVALVAGTGATIWTPAAGKKFRLMGWAFSSSAAAGLIFGDNLVATVLHRTPLLAAAGIDKESPASIGNGYLSALANNVLKLDCSVGTTVTGVVWGTEE